MDSCDLRHLSSIHLPKLNQSLNDQLLSYF